ncbi:MAG: ribonuclease D [Nitrospiraceae bacterium]
MSPSNFHYIADSNRLRDLCRSLGESKHLALDTEFVGEDSFVPRLELIQVAVEDLSAIIDVPAVDSLDCFREVLANPDIEKVVHAGKQDLELLHALVGQVPVPVFDTQLAAAMVGYGTQVGYAQLVHRVVGTKLAKSHTLTNWSQRPLTQEQIAYALEDVQYLLPIYEHLYGQLQRLGRLDWIKEEFAKLESSPTDESRDPRNRYQRMRGWDNLRPRSVAVLRELAAWREGEARRRNIPRGRVIRDEVLLELARRTAATPAALRATRGLHPSEVERNGETLLQIIRRGLALPESEWPEIPRARRPEPEAAGQVDLLQAVLKACAQEEEIAPSLLASVSDLQTLVDAKRTDRDKLDLPILHGWRRRLAGETLLRVLEGKIVVSVDSQTGKLRLTSHA